MNAITQFAQSAAASSTHLHAPALPEAQKAPVPRNFEPELFAQLSAAWKAAAKAKSIDAASIAAWAIIRGADPKKGFTPITNPAKLANGAQPWAARDGALSCCGRLGCAALAPWAALLAEQGASSNGWQWSGTHPLLALLRQAKP